MKKIIVDGSEIEVLDYQWITARFQPFSKSTYRLKKFSFNVDYIKVKISRHNWKEVLNKVLLANEYVIEDDDKKAKFYLHIEEMKRLFDWHKSESEEIEIEFVGTGNEVD